MARRAQPPYSHFTRKLSHWNLNFNDREMPWKGEKDPYRIWLSEIILQQTRVEQGLKYYEAFVREFPDIHKLASAREEKVFKLWEGLGYYTRCRNLIHTAREISQRNNGVFPDQYESIIKLRGVGPYTAAAISSFAFGLPHAVIDGNVVRVISRVFGISSNPIGSEGKKNFESIATKLLDKDDPASHNQAIMDFGATVCKPQAPLCSSCIFKKLCFAYKIKKVDSFPLKTIKSRVRYRWFYFMVLRKKGRLAVGKRTSGDIWKDLYAFPVVEMKKKPGSGKIQEILSSLGYQSVKHIVTITQQLTHQKIEARFLLIELDEHSKIPDSFSLRTKDELEKLAFPKMLRQYLQDTAPLG